jgi:hypothetical protein
MLILAFFVSRFLLLGFNETGFIQIQAPSRSDTNRTVVAHYKYNSRRDNRAARTLEYLSTSASDRMKPCPTCAYYPDFDKFHTYYGVPDYGNRWILAALTGNSTDGFLNGMANFKGMSKQGRMKAVTEGTIVLNVLMYVIRAMEQAITDCRADCATVDTPDCQVHGVHQLDEAVAFYVGSIPVTDPNDAGVMLYSHAFYRAVEARTGGESGEEVGGEAMANILAMREFGAFQQALNAKQCDLASTSKNVIVNLLKVPLIQGLLRVAFQREHFPPEADRRVQVEQLTVWGATYAAALLPWIHVCDAMVAENVFEMMHAGSPNSLVDFSQLRDWIEPLYTCLAVTCQQVGGVYDSDSDNWFPGGQPCGTAYTRTDDSVIGKPSSSGSNTGAAIGAVVGVMVGLIFVWFCCCRKGKKEKNGKGISTYSDSNIAAVAEIS